jgi:O-antigen ligase
LPQEPSIADQILSKVTSTLGVSSESLYKIKFGSGAVGKLSWIAFVALLAIGIGISRSGPNGVLIGIAAVLVVFLCATGAILYIVKVRPEVAVMEGMELVRYKQITLAAKGHTQDSSLTLPPVPDPLALPANGQKENEP